MPQPTDTRPVVLISQGPIDLGAVTLPAGVYEGVREETTITAAPDGSNRTINYFIEVDAYTLPAYGMKGKQRRPPRSFNVTKHVQLGLLRVD